jgi:hypothetical protein
VANAGRDAEQNHAVLCAEFCRRLFNRHPRQLWEEAAYRSLIAYSPVGLPLTAVTSCAKGT